MSNIVVRQASLEDLDALTGLFDEYRQFYGRESDLMAARTFLRARFNHGESTLFIAHDLANPVGFAQLYPSFSSVSMVRTFILNDLYVRPKIRRKGVARSLLAAAENFGNALGAVRLTLSTAITNEQAQALYLAAGWKRDEQFHVFHRAIQA
jgi:ribosomal protein S18 acetylase RimI-like enzyme